MTAVARSNYDLYTKGGVTLATERFGTHPGWKPYRSESESLENDLDNMISHDRAEPR